MIVRRWHGYATPDDADEYERRLTTEILPDSGDIDGYHGHELLRRDPDDTPTGTGTDGPDDAARVEFCTLLYFDSMDAVRAFAGDDPEQAHVPERAREVLDSWDDRVTHYERVERVEN